MQSRLIQYSSVVVGQSHNPTILNPDFLAMQGIVPTAWRWRVKETMTTPPLSFVRYDNDVSVTVEQDKISVVDPNVEGGPEASKVSDLTSRYLEVLPHVAYKAVGNNFQSLVPMEDPEGYLKSRFLKAGPWTTDSPMLSSAGIRLMFPLESGGRFSLTLDAGVAILPDKSESQQVLVVNANFNRSSKEKLALDVAVKHLRSAIDDWRIYDKCLTKFCELEASNE